LNDFKKGSASFPRKSIEKNWPLNHYQDEAFLPCLLDGGHTSVSKGCFLLMYIPHDFRYIACTGCASERRNSMQPFFWNVLAQIIAGILVAVAVHFMNL
ncbi:MAG: hypothetical protein R3Y11_12220, partial [Pseudomonadota bacterium]